MNTYNIENETCCKCGYTGELVYNDLITDAKCQYCGEWQQDNGEIKIDILKDNNEIKRLHSQYNSNVKDKYRTNIENFKTWLAIDGHENNETGENYIEIPGNETLSGHAEILDW